MNIEIANRLVQLRKKHGYSQEELAAKLGISRQAVSKWERAESSPDTDNLILLSRLYGVSLDALLATEDDIPEPKIEDEETKGSTAEDTESRGQADDGAQRAGEKYRNVSFKNGIHISDNGDDVHIGLGGIRVNSAKGERVYVGWNGIHVEEGDEASADGNASKRERVHVGWDGIHIEESDKTSYKDASRGKRHRSGKKYGIDDIENIVADEEGVRFTENGEEHYHRWNDTRNGKRCYIRKEWNKDDGMWHILIIDEKGRKTSIVTRKYVDPKAGDGWKASVQIGASEGFPYAVFVTIAFLLLGFIGGWWHPAWLLFLTIPIYYPIVNAFRKRKLNALDLIVPVVVAGGYMAIGFISDVWHPTWLMLLIIPLYFIIAAVMRSDSKSAAFSNGWYPTFTVILYLVLGFTLGGMGWAAGWLVFFTIPMYYSIVNSIRKNRGIGWIKAFPWEVLMVAAYLFIGIVHGLWHPYWVMFIGIPILHWVTNAIGGSRRTEGGYYESSDDDIDADEFDEDEDL